MGLANMLVLTEDEVTKYSNRHWHSLLFQRNENEQLVELTNEN